MTLSELAEKKLNEVECNRQNLSTEPPGLDKGEHSADVPFPTDVFPMKLQELITEYSTKTGIPDSFLGASMLTVAGATLGNSLRLKYGAYEGIATLFMCLIARRGTGKTHPMEFALAPLVNIDKTAWKSYKREHELWKSIPKQKSATKAEAPSMPNIYVPTDTTPEALVSLHENNARGFILYRDEITGFLNSFDQYSTGGESQKWLQIWNGSSVTVARKSSGITRIEKPHIPILGSIQPEILPKLGEKNRGDDGFLDRLLFVYPNEVFAQPLTMENINGGAWNDCIGAIHNLPPLPDGEPHTAILAKESWEILKTNDSNLVEIVNSDDVISAGIAAKLRIYQFRFSLILNSIYWACGTTDDLTTICESAATGAGKLCSYFLYNAQKVHGRIAKSNERNFTIRSVHRLKEQGKTHREISEILGIAIGTVSKYLGEMQKK